MRREDRKEVQASMSMEEWLKTRPPAIREAALKIEADNPATVLRIKGTRQFCDLYSLYETADGVRVKVVTFNRGLNEFVMVFGYTTDEIEVVKD